MFYKSRAEPTQFSAKSLPNIAPKISHSNNEDNWALNMLENVGNNNESNIILRRDLKEEEYCVNFISIIKGFFCSSKDS